MFKPIDIIYTATKRIEIEPFLWWYFKSIFIFTFKRKKRNVVSVIIAIKFLFWKQGEKNIENCSGRPGVVYNFNNQNLISYQDNFHAKGDVPFVIYFDFETTAPTDNCLDAEQTKMFVVSEKCFLLKVR